MTAERRLVELVAELAELRRRGEPTPDRSTEVAELVIELAAREDDSFERLFSGLIEELAARGLTMPSLDELPPTLAPFAAAFGGADLDATARELDAAIEHTHGTSPRKLREAQLSHEIRTTIADSVADSMRRHGLTPLRDQPPDDSDPE